jgi:hypothetical protein
MSKCQPKKDKEKGKWWSVLVMAAILTAAFPFRAISQSSVKQSDFNVCVWTLTPVDKAPGNGWEQHNKLLFAIDAPEDLTQLFLSGQLHISYTGDNSNILGTADNNAWWIGVQSMNQWGLSTVWTWTNPDFTSYDWLALWNC